MEKQQKIDNFIVWIIPAVLGFIAVGIQSIFRSQLLDPLVIAILLGMMMRFLKEFDPAAKQIFRRAPMIFIPIGVIFYGALNLNADKLLVGDPSFLFLLVFIFMIYLVSALFLSAIFQLPYKVGYLLTTGSVVCGASAIAITSKAVDAQEDEVSVSLIAVFLAGIVGLCVLFLTCTFFHSQSMEFAALRGSVLQFTGFVKLSVSGWPEQMQRLALTLKSIRYLGLIFLIPLFGSFVKKRFYIPWYLIVFALAGAFFSVFTKYNYVLFPVFKVALNVLWAMAMAAIGLNADIRLLFSKLGFKAFAVALLSFVIASAVYMIAVNILFAGRW